MKNSNLFLLASLLFAMVSCGTLAQQGMYGTTQFRNSIYYSPQKQQTAVYAQQSEPVMQYGQVQQVEPVQQVAPVLQLESETTYVITGDDDSYAAKLRKFDSPVYTVNIVIDDPYPWWGVDYAWGRWGWSSWRWGVSSWDRWYWYNSLYSPWYNPWYTPWYSHWHNHWYAGSYWDWYWGDPWWRHHHHRPVYHPAPGKGPSHARPGQGVYYGKRDAGPSYRNPGRGNVTAGGAAPMGQSSQGSITRKPSDPRINQGNQQSKPQQNGSNPQVQQQGGQKNHNGQNTQNTQYRRTEGKKENVKSTNSQSNRNNSGSQYNRNSSGNRSSSSYSSGRSSYSSGSSSSRSGGSSSSYRRR